MSDPAENVINALTKGWPERVSKPTPMKRPRPIPDVDRMRVEELEDVISVVYEVIPEARGLLRALVGAGDLMKMAGASESRAIMRGEK